MLTLTHRVPTTANATACLTLELTAEERTRSRYRLTAPTGQLVHLQLPRGTVLQNGDLLQTSSGEQVVQIVAKPEPILTVTGQTVLDLLRAAYHLGNRHVPLEVTAHYLRLAPDPVLQSMLEQLGLQVVAEVAPFQPEAGAYGNHSHGH